MTEASGAALRPSDILPDLMAAVGDAAHNGKTFADLDMQTKGHLALLGYFGTDPANAPHPGGYWRHHGQHNQERMLGKLAGNADYAMSHVPEYQTARATNTLGLTMADAYTNVRAVRHHGVHVTDPKLQKGEVVDGVVTAMLTSYTLPDEQSGLMLHTLFQGMHNKYPTQHVVKPLAASEDWQTPEDPWDLAWVPPAQTYDAEGNLLEVADPLRPLPYTVEVTNLNEYQRIITEAIRVLVRQELRAIGVVLPEWKVPLADWQQTTTFRPEILKWLQAIADTYDKMHERGFVQADYVGDPAGQRLRPDRRLRIIGTDPSAVSKAERDEINGLLHKLKARGGDSRYNQEQHPNRNQRYEVERHVHLKRPRVPRTRQQYYAPSLARPLNVAERAFIEIKETWREVRESPTRHIPEMLGNIAGKMYGGVIDLIISGSVLAIKGLAALGKGARNHWHDARSWWEQRRQATTRLDSILQELHDMRTEIAERRLADQFPDSSLPPSRQLELVKGMTAKMLANL